MAEPLIFQLSSPGRKGITLPEFDVPYVEPENLIGKDLISNEAPFLPEVSEPEVVRHFIRLSQKNYSVDTGLYPLGSCTMKYNPKINEAAAKQEGFANLHPYEPFEFVQGALQVMAELEDYLCKITGMERFTLQPAAGAHGELTAMLMARAYFNHKKERRGKILVPDSAHGTNPASAAMSGFEVIQIKSDISGNVDIDDLKSKLDESCGVFMLTNPNTLGLFDNHILKISALVHEMGAIMYYDGANLNAILGIASPADMGFDLVHLNLHKTFSAPHGGGGPGSGPVGARGNLVSFLPVPLVEWDESTGRYILTEDYPLSIGRMRAFYGNFLILLRAYTYIRSLGCEGLKKTSRMAVLNANYLMNSLKEDYHIPYERICQHEFVLSAKKQKEKGIKALDIAKRLLDFGFHPPTIYFPLIVEEAMMIEPTETETKETLDCFIDAMKQIARETVEEPEKIKNAPAKTPVGRLDEVAAARKPDLRWKE